MPILHILKHMKAGVMAAGAESGITAFVGAIPSAAASPLALVAYLSAVAAWTLIAWRVRRHAILLAHIHELAESDRLPAIFAELGHIPIPPDMTAEQYLRDRIHSYIFGAFLAACMTVTVIFGITFYEFTQQKSRSESYINQILDTPTSQYMSSVNVLSNGQQMVVDAAREVRPPMSNNELSEIVRRLVDRGYRSAEDINERLAELAGTGQLKKVNIALLNGAKRIDETYKQVADCYRSASCRSGSGHEKLCRAVASIQSNIDLINSTAITIKGVRFNSTGSPSMLGDGSMDISFNFVSSNNVKYLHNIVCGNQA